MNELKAKLTAALKRVSEIASAAEAADRDLTAEERNQITGLMDEAKGYKAKLAQRASDADLVKEIEALGAGLTDTSARGHQTAVKHGAGESLGERFASADGFKNWVSQFPEGRVPESFKGFHSPPVAFKGMDDLFGRKTLVTGVSDSQAGALIFNDTQAGILPLGRRPIVMRDAVTPGRTTSDTIEYVQVLTETNNAEPVAEATAAGGSSGVKPESGMTLGRFTETVKTIAHWIPATKRALSDAGQIRTLIDNFLRDGLEQELEDQMVNGNGVGENFTGLNNISGTQTQAWDTNIFVTTRRARTKIRTVGRTIPNAYLLNPVDWETIQLERDGSGGAGTGQFLFGGPAAANEVQTLWGLPVIESEAVVQGTGYTGNFRKLVLYDREAATIQVSDSHSDFFIRNLVAILAELRAAFVCLQPSAFIEMDLTA